LPLLVYSPVVIAGSSSRKIESKASCWFPLWFIYAMYY